MKKILGLDIGSSSIGWAMVNEAQSSKEESSIIKLGVRVIHQENVVRDFQQGNAVTINEGRRMKRGARRNLKRFKLRRRRLQMLLMQRGLMKDDGLTDLTTEKLYHLRDKAVKEKIEKLELGRVLLHMNNKRGYKSNRKANNDGEEGEYLTAITNRSRHLKEEGMTVGQYLYGRYKDNPHNLLKKQIFYRQDYVDEFNAIWDQQCQHYPDVLTTDYKQQVGDWCLFYQRPLKSQKRLVSNCRFEQRHKAAAKSSPLFQLFNLLQKLNNLEVYDKETHQSIGLNAEQRQVVLDKLKVSKELSRRNILKLLKLTPEKRYELNFEKLDGDRTRFDLIKAFEGVGLKAQDVPELDLSATGNDFDKGRLMKLWHILYSIDDEGAVVKALVKWGEYTQEQARGVAAAINWKSDYGALSSRAIRKILPYLLEGLKYSEACDRVGYRHSDSLTVEENMKRQLKDKLELVPKNTLRNPIVEKVLNQMVSLVNAIMADETLGRPDEVRVELARELKQSAKQRKRTADGMKKREASNKKIRALLTSEFGILKPTRKDIERYRLWVETDQFSLYSGNAIPKADLFSAKIEIEHIIPRSVYFDDSFQNKTLCETALNKEKNNRTAFDYMMGRGEAVIHTFEQQVKRCYEKKAEGISKTKRNYLLMKKADIPDDFISRQLCESQYIARQALSMLRLVVREVSSSTGSVTAYLRHQWGLTEAMRYMNLAKYRERGQTCFKEQMREGQMRKVEQIDGWSKRDDHRHHAMDALVVAFTSAKHIQYLNHLAGTTDWGQEQLRVSGRRFAPPMADFFAKSIGALEAVLISFKQNKRATTMNTNTEGGNQKVVTPRGALHEETVYGKMLWPGEKIVKISNRFTPEQARLIVNPLHRQLVVERLEAFDNDPSRAFKVYRSNPVYVDVQKKVVLEGVELYEERYTIRKPLTPDFKNVDKIIDGKVRQVVQNRLDEFGGNSKKAFANLEEQPVWLNREKGIKVERVKLFAHVTKAEEINRGFVVLGNNHHMALYENDQKQRTFDLVSQLESTKRIVGGADLYQRRHPQKGRLICVLHINDMVLYDPQGQLAQLDVTLAVNLPLVSSLLYRVQKMSGNANSPDVVLRHHLATKIDNNDEMVRLTSIGRLKGLKKVILDKSGNIVEIEVVL